MENILIIAVLAVILGLAGWYVIKAKKNGPKCIGCPSGGCGKQCDGCGYSCACGEEKPAD